MALSEQEKRRLIAITKELRRKKGIKVKKEELNLDIVNMRQAQKEITKIKESSNDLPKVVEEADKSHAKLQGIIDSLNEYMQVLAPTGLLDVDGGSASQGGSQMSVSG